MINTATNSLLFSPNTCGAPLKASWCIPRESVFMLQRLQRDHSARCREPEHHRDHSGSAGGGADNNPQGIAITPDGRTLLFSDNSQGGVVTVMDLTTKATITAISDPNAVPMGIAINPDGVNAYFAFSGPTRSRSST